MNVLNKIIDDKRQHIALMKARTPLSELEAMVADHQQSMPVRGFQAALNAAHQAGKKPLIAEIKKASPSKGLIRADFDPAQIADSYHAGGASCLSVLTDMPYFQGDDSYIGMARGAVSLPILRKDFMIDPYQIVESRALGADCILLILACLDDVLVKELADIARNLTLDILLEVHDHAELERALKLDYGMIGVNNRNLKSLDIDLQIGLDLLPLIPKHRFSVAESGLYQSQDLVKMADAGAKAFLIGESLMRQSDIKAATKALLGF